MADVASAELAERIQTTLDQVWDRWSSLPETSREIEGWDLEDQLDYVEEWAVTRSQMDLLETWRSEGLLSPQQQRTLKRVNELGRRLQPILEELER
jgi:hypothetical protein